MSQNGQTQFKNLAAFAARFLKCAWPFYDIVKQSVDEIIYKAGGVYVKNWAKHVGEYDGCKYSCNHSSIL